MYLVELSFNNETEVTPDAVSEPLNRLLRALRMNGQICGREFSIIASPKKWTAFILATEQDALDTKYFNRYGNAAFERLRSLGLSEPNIEILGKDIDSADTCTCQTPSSYILYTNYISLEPPLRCGDCFLPVPLYRIPPTYDDEYYDIVSWASDYQACDQLQMNCRTFERSTTREISRLDSNLSQFGREICARIFQLTGRPTYYYLYRYNGRSRTQELKCLCPSCGGIWLCNPPWHSFDFKCDKCCLVSNVAWNVRQKTV